MTTNWIRRSNYKEIEQNQLTWYGHVQRMTEGRLPKIALKWMPKQKKSARKTDEKLDGRYKEGHERKKPKRRSVGRYEAVESRCGTT